MSHSSCQVIKTILSCIAMYFVLVPLKACLVVKFNINSGPDDGWEIEVPPCVGEPMLVSQGDFPRDESEEFSIVTDSTGSLSTGSSILLRAMQELPLISCEGIVKCTCTCTWIQVYIYT